MKKILKVGLTIVLISMLFIFSACQRSTETNNAVITNETASITENVISENDIKEFDVREIYLKIIKNEEEFIGIDFENLEGEKGYLKDFQMCGQSEQIAKYGFVDMDGDGVEEMVGETTSDGGFYIVFHYEDEQVYGYLISARAIYDVKVDGTFCGTGGATTYGYSKVKFNKTEYTEIDLADRWDDSYTIDGTKATREAFETFENNQKAKKDIEMQIFVNDEIGAEILNFDDNNEVVFIQSEEGGPQSEFIYVILTLKKDGTVTEEDSFPGATEQGAMAKGTYIYKKGKIIATFKQFSNPESPDVFYTDFNTKTYEIKNGKLYNQESQYYTAEYERKK